MSAAIIQIADSKAGKRVFVFREACPVCGVMVKPFVIAGRASNRFRCDSVGSPVGEHAPHHWKAGENDLQFDEIKPGYDIPTGIVRIPITRTPDAS
jgi:hypothetical protein